MTDGIGNTNSNSGRTSSRTSVGMLIVITIGLSALLATPAFASKETILYSFAGAPDSANPARRLIQDAAGNLYGVTTAGGIYGGGTAFELSPHNGTWVETVLHSFGGPGDGRIPSGTLILDNAGNLYGGAPPVVYKLSSDGQGNWTETILKTFTGKPPLSPIGALTMDTAGILYGATEGVNGRGVIYRLSPPAKNSKTGQWKYALLYRFPRHKGNNGGGPTGDMVFDGSGNLYGTTNLGGANGQGSVFELSPAAKIWTENTLYSFEGLADGGNVVGSVIFDATGNLYGTAVSGGAHNAGVVFEVSPGTGGWSETVLYSFTGGSDGEDPIGPLTLHMGNLYGVTVCGGNGPQCSDGNGDGVVFELSPSGGGWTQKVLHAFSALPDGTLPQGGVMFDSSGNLYGTTFYGGSANNGTVYKIKP